MFCNQCEQTSKGTGCVTVGVCGKKADVAALQDLLSQAVASLSRTVRTARERGVEASGADRLACEALFATLTNVNFDPQALAGYVGRISEEEARLRERAGLGPASWQVAPDLAGMVSQGERMGYPGSQEPDADLRSLQEILLYGVRGVAAYAFHAADLGQEDQAVYDFIHQAMASHSCRDRSEPSAAMA
ncbi:MAG: hydroxylamine reductase, partial [Syntrophomonadaceae bacterium]|nr:hydroxylamine reductase [Syntrophomonadaceae bacterium]